MMCKYVADGDLENPKDQPRKCDSGQKVNSKKTFNYISSSISSVAIHDKINRSNLSACIQYYTCKKKIIICCISVIRIFKYRIVE